MITPGSVVITVAFIGFLVAGLAGATMAAIGIFLPVYFFTILPRPGSSATAIIRSSRPLSTAPLWLPPARLRGL
jgi:hypothetical protein